MQSRYIILGVGELYHCSVRSVAHPTVVFFACTRFALCADEGSIRGGVVDPASSTAAEVRVMEDGMGATLYRTRANQEGMFQVDRVPSGMYAVWLRQPGFRPKTVHGVVVAAEKATELSEVKFFWGGCEAPGVECDCFGVVEDCGGLHGKRGYLSLEAGSEADLDSSTTGHALEEVRGADVVLSTGEMGALYLSARGFRSHTGHTNCSTANRNRSYSN